jgi:CHAT domain-containing protein
MKAAVLQLSQSSLFDGVEVTLDEMKLPVPAASRAAAVLAPGKEPIYTMIRQESAASGKLGFRVSVLGSGMKAAVVSLPQVVDESNLNSLLQSFDEVAGTDKAWDVDKFGAQFAELMLPEPVRNVLAGSQDRHVVLVHDAAASRIPWETIRVDKWTPSITAGLSRRYLADNLPIATWLEQRRKEPTLTLLLIVDPTSNLPGALDEGERLLKLSASIDGLEVTELHQERATKEAVLGALRSGKYDIVHYAGHAYFDETERSSSGLLLAGDEVLSGADLTGASNLPFLVFFNACQAGRVRGAKTRAPETPAATSVAQGSYGVAEALMRGGISNYLSTYWPVGDDAAKTFSSRFYQGVLKGASIGEALLDGRKAVQKSRDWADYILYGSYDFILKRRS